MRALTRRPRVRSMLNFAHYLPQSNKEQPMRLNRKVTSAVHIIILILNADCKCNNDEESIFITAGTLAQ